MTTRSHRHERIRREIVAGGVASQEDLARRLRAAGIRATQATLSRDLRTLGAVKGPRGYALPGEESAPEPARSGALAEALRSFLVSAEAGGNLAVLRTGPGRAQALALEIDRASLAGVVGTVAGDDTVFVASRTAREAERLCRRFRSLGGIHR
ncbi:MAG: arginine repressor [Phycisphaerae bacterium]|nr:arginine repressor [Phycisphaerae bacterium]